MSSPQNKEFAKTTHTQLLEHIKGTDLVGWELAALLWTMRNEVYIKNKKTKEQVPLFTMYADAWKVYVETILGISLSWASQMESVWHQFYEGEFKGLWPIECRLSPTKMLLIGKVSSPSNIASNVEEAFEHETTIEELEFAVQQMSKKTTKHKWKMKTIAIHMSYSDYEDILPRWNAFKEKNNVIVNIDAFKALLKKAKA